LREVNFSEPMDTGVVKNRSWLLLLLLLLLPRNAC